MKQPELVYWKGSGEVRADLLQAIRVVGYDLTLAVNIDDLLRRPAENLPGLIVVDASGGEAEASKRLIELSSATLLAPLPIIFISYQANKRASILKKTFKKLLPVDVPFKLQALLSQFLELCPVAGGGSPEAITGTGAAKEVGVEVPAYAAPPVPAQQTRVAHTITVIPAERLTSFGGEFFALSSTLERINDSLILPAEHPAKSEMEKALAKLTEGNAFLGLHSRRVTFLTAMLANLMEFAAEKERAMRVAGLFLNFGFIQNPQGLDKHDLLLFPDEEASSAMASRFLESAQFVRDRLNDSEAASTIESISQLLTLNGTSDGESSLDAQCVLVPELASRSIWNKGYWDSYGAHRTIRCFQKGSPIKFSDKLVSAVSRVISEASEIMTRTIVIKEKEETKSLADAKKEAEKLFASKNQREVRLLQLEPGMKLSQPLLTADGRLILRANTQMTPELISRIWRLSSLVALDKAVKVLGV